jgi:hypothetical protein
MKISCPIVFLNNEWSTSIQIPCLKNGPILFWKTNTLILPKSSLQLISSKCLTFWLTTYLLCMTGVFSNRQSAYICVLTVIPFSPTCSAPLFVLRKNEKKLTRSFNFTLRYIDVCLSLTNCKFGDCVDCIYPIELEIKDTTYTAWIASCIDPKWGIVNN